MICMLGLFLQDFLKSEGIEINPPDEIPPDPYTDWREKSSQLKTSTTPSQFDKLKQFLEMDGKVLRFFCIWDDRENMFGERKQFILHVSTLSFFNKMRNRGFHVDKTTKYEE